MKEFIEKVNEGLIDWKVEKELIEDSTAIKLVDNDCLDGIVLAIYPMGYEPKTYKEFHHDVVKGIDHVVDSILETRNFIKNERGEK